jgi:hypothetical protein
MGKKKEINEKTFELNITNELLNISSSFLWYLDDSPISLLFPKHYWSKFLNNNVFFATGLTQEEESSPGGGYDVCINFKNKSFVGSKRLLFLQYKAGVNKTRCNNKNSNFNTSKKNIRDTNHVLFTFNDAAKKKQHGILRDLANKPEIQSESVMYVFPRITKKPDFENKVGSLLLFTSFVPVLDLDRQASLQTPPITINDGTVHKYRTSYDGYTSEVNLLMFIYHYDPYLVFRLIAELICVQVERFAIFYKRNDGIINKDFLESVSRAVKSFLDDYFIGFKESRGIREQQTFNNLLDFEEAQSIIVSSVENYIKELNPNNEFLDIPIAPQKYTKVLPEDGLVLNFDSQDLSNIQYQIF